MKSVLITGCNRGIGLALIKNIIQKSKYDNVIATCRNIQQAQELRELQHNSNLHILEIDLKNFNNYNELYNETSKIVSTSGLNVLINNAGISQSFHRLKLVKVEQMLENFTINTVGPIMLTKAMLPLLQTAASSEDSAKVVNISSVLGSIQSNESGGYYPYRCSKSALNAATKSMSVDLKNDGIIAVAVHPGWVKTDMGGKKAPIEPADSAESILNLISRICKADSGKFLNVDGTTLHW